MNPRNGHCFGCHSRSGRIALCYEGWNELREETGDNAAPTAGKRAGSEKIRKLDDGRFVEKIVADVHHERGMECIDCHTANELMGAGAEVLRKSQQQRVGCEDCHAAKLVSVAPEFVDAESRLLHKLRGWTLAPGQRMGTTRDGEPLVNVVVEEGKGARLLRKRTGEALAAQGPRRRVHAGQGPRTALLRELPHRLGAALQHLPHRVRPEGRGLRPRRAEVGEGHVERDGRAPSRPRSRRWACSTTATRAARSTPSCPA